MATWRPDVRKSCGNVGQRKFNHPRGVTKVESGAFWVRHQVQTNSRNPAKTSYPALVPGPMKTEHSGAAHRSANQSVPGLLWQDTCSSVLWGPLKKLHTHDLLRIFCCVVALFSRIILFIMSSSDEIDNPAAVDSSGSEFEEEDVTQEPRRKKVGDRSQWAKKKILGEG